MPRLALLGGAHIHVRDFLQLIEARRDASLVVVWDHDRERAQRIAVQARAEVAVKLSDLPWEDIDAVVVCPETNRQPELIRSVVPARLPMFVEKPLAQTFAAAQLAALQIEETNVLFHTGFFFRQQPIYRVLREAVQTGVFGRVTQIQMSFGHAGSILGWFSGEYGWMTDPRQSSPHALADLGIHLVDLLIWIFGLPEQVLGVLPLTAPTGAFAPSGLGLLRFENGLLASVAASHVDVSDPVPLILRGTGGSATLIDGHLQVEGPAGEWHKWTSLPPLQLAASDALAVWLDALEGKESPENLVAPMEAAERVRILEAIQRSITSGSWTTL